VLSRRLDDRIRELCAKAASAPASEVGAVLEELKAALAEHATRLRKLAANKLIHDGGWGRNTILMKSNQQAEPSARCNLRGRVRLHGTLLL